MKLWLIKRTDIDPFESQYIGIVVRAETEQLAREIAVRDTEWSSTSKDFADFEKSTCVELTAEGDAGIILEQFDRECD